MKVFLLLLAALAITLAVESCEESKTPPPPSDEYGHPLDDGTGRGSFSGYGGPG
jgi:hypothetical protein